MKPTTMITFLMVFFAYCSYAQTPYQNEGFENWNEEKHFEEPVNWTANYFGYASNSQTFVQKSQQTYSGNYAVRLINDTTGQGFITPGEISLKSSNFLEGVPFSKKVDSISFYTKYDIQTGDSALFTAKFTNSGTVIDSNAQVIKGTATNYQRFSIPFDWSQNDPTPDTLRITAQTSLGNTSALNEFFIDKITTSNPNAPVPNGDFENWTSYKTKSPVDWSSFNRPSFYFGDNMVKQSTNSHSGNYAARVRTSLTFLIFSLDTFGFMTAGPRDGFDFKGKPVGDKPRSLSFYHQYNPNGNDTGFISLQVFHYDQQADTSINIGSGAQFLAEEQTYKKKTAPIFYDTSLTADSIRVFISSGTIPGSQALVDDLSVSYSCSPTSSTISARACGSYLSPSRNNTWTKSGTYKDTVLNEKGCDSIITINLTVKDSINETQAKTVCDSFYWQGNGETYTNSGTYKDTFTSSSGCDSFVTINLTVSEIDSSVTKNNTTLQANTSGATYQWLDCENNYAPVSGATSQSFSPSATGTYAVAVTRNGCTDTSQCYQVKTTGLAEKHANQGIQAYPNPASDQLTLVQQGNFEPRTFELQTLTGRTIQSGKLEGQGEHTVDVSDVSAGVYLLQVKTEEAVRTKKVIVK